MHGLSKNFIIFFTLLIFFSGCLASEKSETISIPEGHMYSFSFNMPEDSEVQFELETNRKAVDLLVLDEENYKIYEKAFTGGKGATFKSLESHPGVISTSISFTSYKNGIYYIVIENADVLKDGVSPAGDVIAQVSYRT